MDDTKEKISSKITFIIIFVFIIAIAFRIFASFLIAIVVGALVAVVLNPIQKKLITKKINSKLSAYLVFVMLVILVVIPISYFIKYVVVQAVAFKDSVSMSNVSYSSIFQSIAKFHVISYFVSDPVEFELQIKTLIIESGSWISTFALKQASKIPTFLVQAFFALLSCLFFLLEGRVFVKFLYDKVPLRKDIWISLISSFKKSSRSAIWATLLAAASQSIVIFLSFIILNVPAAFLAAGATFIFAFIPLLGSFPVWLSASIYLYLEGSITKLVIMIVLGLLSSFIDNIVRVFVLKGSKGLHPLIGLFAVLGGMQIFGFFGVIIGPVIVAILISMLEVWSSVFKNSRFII